MAKAKKATKAKGNKATVAKAADFKTAIVKEPKAVLQAIGMDFSVAYDKSNNKATMGDVLAAGSKKQREDFAVELEQALVKANEIWTGFESKVDTFIPGQFKRIPADEKIWPVRPVIPGPDPIIPRNPRRFRRSGSSAVRPDYSGQSDYSDSQSDHYSGSEISGC